MTAIFRVLTAASLAFSDNYARTMAACSKLKLADYDAVNPDCSTAGDAVIRILNQPSHGTHGIGKGVAYPHYLSSDPRGVCNVRRIPCANVEYAP